MNNAELPAPAGHEPPHEPLIERLPPQNPKVALKRANEVAKCHAVVGRVEPVAALQGHEQTTVMKVLTQPAKKGTHRETEITIDWSGVTQEDLYALARNALVADAMCRMVREDDFPLKLKVVAKAHVYKPSPSVEKWTYQPPKLKIDKALEAYLSGLTKEEIQILLGG